MCINCVAMQSHSRSSHYKGVDTGGGGGGGGGGGAWGLKPPPPPRFSALHYILLGTVIDFYQILAFVSLKKL